MRLNIQYQTICVKFAKTQFGHSKVFLAFLFMLNDLASILLCILTDILQTGVFFNKKKPQLLFVAQVAEV